MNNVKITLRQLLDTFYFGNPNEQQVMVYTDEDYYHGRIGLRDFEEPEFTIGCSTTMSSKNFIKEEWLNKTCDIIDFGEDGNVRVVLDMEEE